MFWVWGWMDGPTRPEIIGNPYINFKVFSGHQRVPGTHMVATI